jgi:aldehyde dehydrogenase family 7 protein A1
LQIWKGAPSSSLVTVAQTKLLNEVLEECGFPGSIATMCQGGGDIGQHLVEDRRLNLISFTGSTKVGRGVATTVAGRFGSSILELGGNNAVIVMDDANLDVAIPSVLFAAAGTAGQRCTTLRRLVLHEKIYDEFVAKLVAGYSKIKPGNPLEPGTLLGPLHNEAGLNTYLNGIEEIKKQGGKVRLIIYAARLILY